MTPVEPPKNAIGMNTAASTSAMPTSAPVIWPIDLRVASFGDRPSSLMRRSTFSTTTIASSTSKPMVSTMPNIVSTLIEKPKACMTPKVPSSTTGTAIAGISVARRFCRNRYITRHDQHERLEQGLDHLLDRQPDERRGVEGDDRLQARREEALEFGGLGLDRVRGGERVGAGGEPHREARRRLAVVEGERAVVLAAQLDARDVAQPHRRAGGAGAQDDGLELRGRLQPALRRDGRVQLLARHGGQPAELARGDLDVLCADRGRDVGRGEPVARRACSDRARCASRTASRTASARPRPARGSSRPARWRRRSRRCRCGSSSRLPSRSR